MQDRRAFLKSISATLAGLATAPAVLGQTGSEKRGQGPNIILIVSDEHQANTCGCYGSKVRQVDGRSPTPAIDALAGEGVRFDSMYCPSPLCAPSRAAYMTGMYPHTTTAIYHKMQAREAGLSRFPGVQEGIPGMGDYFRKAGYKTAAYGKMHVHGEAVNGWDLGFDERGLRFYTKASGMHYADLKAGDINRRYREMKPYLFAEYKKIDPEKFRAAPEGLTVKKNGVNEHFLETLVEHPDEMIDHLVTERSIDFMERQVLAGKSFMMHVGLEKPHRPWTVHKKYLDRFSPDDMPLPKTIAEWETKGMHPFVQQWCHSGIKGDAARNSTAAYYACAAQVDDCVDAIVQKCRELDILDNTVIIYTSDHGENLYEHGLIEKHNMLDPAARVPFIIRAPWQISQGVVCHASANLIDILPTLCELAGTDGSPDFEGESLLPAIQGEGDSSRMVFSEFYQSGSCTRKDEFLPVRMGLNTDFKYVYTHAAADQLYKRGTQDEQKGNNQAFDPANEALVSHMKLCTLVGWELDEFPMLDGAAIVSDEGLELSWESAGTGARYDVYRSKTFDPQKAVRVAAALSACHWIDQTVAKGERYFYWILGHYQLDLPFVDGRGKSRYGSEAILSSEFTRSLPITPCIPVIIKMAFQEHVTYEPLLGCSFGGYDWIRIGMPPKLASGMAHLEGPVTVLSPRTKNGLLDFSAELKTARPGPSEVDVAQLLFNYQNMHNYYSVALQRNGQVVLRKRSGEWSFKELARAEAVDVRVQNWNRVRVISDAGLIQVFVNEKRVCSAKDSNPIGAGRYGFDTPLNVNAVSVRSLSLI
jgi:choline-sulfatase